MAFVVALAAASTALGADVLRIVPEAGSDIPLLDPAGQALGPRLSRWQFCELAAAGEGLVASVRYRVVDLGREVQVDCRRNFPRLARKMPVAVTALGRSRFALEVEAP